MSQGSAIVYVPVEANGVSVYVANSSGGEGYYEQGYRVNWAISAEGEGGVVNKEWYINDQNSPFFGIQESEIVSHAKTYGNLNYYFEAWGSKENIDRGAFVTKAYAAGCCDFI